jgi:hypothetical protein
LGGWQSGALGFSLQRTCSGIDLSFRCCHRIDILSSRLPELQSLYMYIFTGASSAVLVERSHLGLFIGILYRNVCPSWFSMLQLALSFRHDVASSHALGSRSEFEPIPSVSFELILLALSSPTGGSVALVGRLLLMSLELFELSHGLSARS